MADLMATLVKNVVQTTWDDLPLEARDAAKMSILDTLGVLIAGSTADGCKAVVDLVTEWGGKPEATVLVHGGKVPAPHAGLANGVMARARDLGTTHERALVHAGEYVMPPALAIAERRGGVSGKEFMTAMALGEDLMFRLGLSVNTKAPCTVSGRYDIFRIFAPTAVAAKLLGLDHETMWMAMGIAYTQACGEMQSNYDGALTVRLQQGLVVEASIKSALLAQRGLTGPHNILQGRGGFYRIFEPLHDLEVLTKDLGKRFEGVTAAYKAYPCCTGTHSAINATLDLVIENDIRAEDVETVRVGVNRTCESVVCLPRETRVAPQTVVHAQFSIPYTVATAVVTRDVFLDDFTPESITRPEVLDLARRVETVVDPDIERSEPERMGASVVRIRMKNG